MVDILASNPDVFGKTVLFINYDEEGGFFDHSVPPAPPFSGAGASTVDTVNEIYPIGDPKHPSGPYGLGMRVPMIVVSPWSKGGWVNSQVFDHTSLVRFIETRYANEYPSLFETNITLCIIGRTHLHKPWDSLAFQPESHGLSKLRRNSGRISH